MSTNSDGFDISSYLLGVPSFMQGHAVSSVLKSVSRIFSGFVLILAFSISANSLP